MERLRAFAAKQHGYAPGHFESGVAPGYSMGKVTIQRGRSGEVERTWKRQSPDQERQQEFMLAAAAAMPESPTRANAIKPPSVTTASRAHD